MQEQIIMYRARLMEEAESFIRQCYTELGRPDLEIQARLAEINSAIGSAGTYTHTFEELERGAKMAWRNSSRCIGRLFWESLAVLDAREARTEDEIAAALLHHIDYATNGGNIRPVLTVFSPAERARGTCGPRIRNHQLLRYAGYETDGAVVGDPASVKMTRLCTELGWKGAGTAFDILPLVVQLEGGEPRWFDIPERLVLRVRIEHPDFPEIGELGLQWYAVPIVSDMRLEIGGIDYTAAPFNGWYMGTEIGARNLADEFRYNMLPRVAAALGLNTRWEATLWRDRALVELNVAVLHSFRVSGAAIVDHHTASRQFGRFEENEKTAGRAVTGNWSWLIPPLSPATTAIFHRHYDNTELKPNFFYQE